MAFIIFLAAWRSSFYGTPFSCFNWVQHGVNLQPCGPSWKRKQEAFWERTDSSQAANDFLVRTTGGWDVVLVHWCFCFRLTLCPVERYTSSLTLAHLDKWGICTRCFPEVIPLEPPLGPHCKLNESWILGDIYHYILISSSDYPVPDCCIPCFCFITASIAACPLVGVPETTPRFDDSLGGVT